MTDRDRPDDPTRVASPGDVAAPDAEVRDRYELGELAIVLSRYDLGAIESIRDFPRGSRRAPKLLIRAEQGDFLLKRRAPGRDDPYRVAFAHHIQLHLEERGYPVAGLVGTRGENNSLLQLHGRTYELFRYVEGSRFDRSAAQAGEAGAALGRLHRLLASHRPTYDPPRGSFHAVADAPEKFARLAGAVRASEPDADEEELDGLATFLREAYEEAAARVDAAGYREWPQAIIHGDWHPGNVVYRDGRIVAVIDFDSARLEPRVSDLANGALQFAMRMGTPEDPAGWPDDFDAKRIRSMIRGYDDAFGQPMDRQQVSAVPWLMIEALIIESVVPIAATGSFSRIPGSVFLDMVRRKVTWLRPRVQRLIRYVDE